VQDQPRKKFYWIQLVTRRQIDSALSDEAPSRLRRQSSRRLLAVLHCIVSLALALSALLPENKLQSYITGIGVIVFIALYLMLRRSVRLLADAPTELLDERTVAIRDRAYMVAYWCISFVFGVFVGTLVMVDFSLDRYQSVALLMSAASLMASMPNMVLAWTLPPESAVP
jgi:uncharacterized membrane protein